MNTTHVALIAFGGVVLVAIGGGVWQLLRWVLDVAHERRRDELSRVTRWSHYLEISEKGEYLIGVRRWAPGYEPFEGPIEMYRFPADYDPIEVQLKLVEAKDRAALYNSAGGPERKG